MIFCDGILLGICRPAFGVCFDESAAAVHTLGTGFLPTLKSGSASSSVTDVPWKEPDVLCCCPEGLGEPELILFTLRCVFHQVCLHDDFWKSTDVLWKEPDLPLLLPKRTARTLTDLVYFKVFLTTSFLTQWCVDYAIEKTLTRPCPHVDPRAANTSHTERIAQVVLGQSVMNTCS